MKNTIEQESKILIDSLKIKRKETYLHSLRVMDYSYKISTELNLSSQQLFNIKIGAVLHDIGKLNIKESIINKPSKLTDEEYLEIKKHTILGLEILNQIESFDNEREIKEIILNHHERLDGSGYPRNLRELDLLSSIVAVADSFDAMTADRVYSKGMSKERAIEILKSESDKYNEVVLSKLDVLIQ